MRFRLTFVLLVLNLVALGFIVLIRMDPGRSTFEESARLILPPGLVGSADRIELSGQALARDWVFTREQNEWRVDSPLAWKANPFAMDRMVQQLSQLRWESRFPVSQVGGPPQEALAQYGLDPAKAVVRVVRGNETWEIPIGEATQVGNRLYLLAPDSRDIQVVSRGIFDVLASDLTSFFDPLIFQIPGFEVRAITIQEESTGRPRVRIARDSLVPNAHWRFESPLQAPGDNEAVRRLLERLHQVEVYRFVAEPPEDAFGSGDLRITIEGNDRRQTVRLGRMVSGNPVPARRFLKIEGMPTVVEVQEDVFAPLFNAQESLRQHRFLDLGDIFPNAIDIILDDRTTTLQRLEGGDWQVADVRSDAADPSRRTRPAEQEVIERVVRRLAELEAERFVTEAPSAADLANRYGLAPPQRTVRLHVPGQSAPVVLSIGHLDPEDNLVYVRRSDMPTVFKVRPGILGLVPVTPLHYRERSLTTLPQAARVRAFRLIDEDTGEILFKRTLSRDLNSWEALEVAEDVEGTGLRDDIAVIRHALRRFQVRDYVAEAFTSPMRLDADTQIPWEFRLEADIQLPGAPDDQMRTDVYYFTERLGGRTQFGGSSTAQVVFTVRQPMIDALEALANAPRPAQSLSESAKAPSMDHDSESDAPESTLVSAPSPAGAAPDDTGGGVADAASVTAPADAPTEPADEPGAAPVATGIAEPEAANTLPAESAGGTDQTPVTAGSQTELSGSADEPEEVPATGEYPSVEAAESTEESDDNAATAQSPGEEAEDTEEPPGTGDEGDAVAEAGQPAPTP